MIKNSYGKGNWTFPGGNIKRGEEPSSAIKREVKEELGVNTDLVFCGELASEAEYKKDKIYVFKGVVEDNTIGNVSKEIERVEWFGINQATQLTPVASRILETSLNN